MIKNVVIFGKRLYYTQGYINYGFYNAFLEFGKYNVYWISEDNLDEMENIKQDTIFVVNDDKNNHLIPLDLSCYYILIKANMFRFRVMDKNKISIVEYKTNADLSKFIEIEDNIFLYKRKRTMIMPYGSMLTPTQIIENLAYYVEKIDRENKYIMTRNYSNVILDEIINTNSKKLIVKKIISLDEEVELIRKIRMSVCYVSIPEKIDYKTLTHLSYGTMCVTNSQATNDFLNNKLCYLTDTSQFETSVESFYDSLKKEDIFSLMELIINNHTFYHRVNSILRYFNIN